MPKPIHIFLSSSAELLAERDQLEIAVSRLNEGLPPDAPKFKVLRWENHEAQFRPQGMQEHYNELVRDCDVFIFVFHGKVGKYSRQEFEAAWKAMVKTGRPTVYVYHKSTALDETKMRPRDRQSLENFRKRLDRLQQFPVHYDNMDRLRGHLMDQLQRYQSANLPLGKSVSAKESTAANVPSEGGSDQEPAKFGMSAMEGMDPPGRTFLVPKIHRLLDAAYDEISLRMLIQLHFPKVHTALGAFQGRVLIQIQLLDHCNRHMQWQRLLDVVFSDNPNLFQYYGPYW